MMRSGEGPRKSELREIETNKSKYYATQASYLKQTSQLNVVECSVLGQDRNRNLDF